MTARGRRRSVRKADRRCPAACKDGFTPSTLLFLATAATLLLALFLGGGQGSSAESLLALAGLGLIAAAAHRASIHETDPKRLRWLFGVPLALSRCRSCS